MKRTAQSMACNSYLMPVGFLFSFLGLFWESFSIRASVTTEGCSLVSLCPCGLVLILLPFLVISAFTIQLAMFKNVIINLLLMLLLG